MRRITALLLLLTLFFGTNNSSADCNCPKCDGCNVCDSCPAHECVRVPEAKPIKKTVYEVRCVPICLHRPSKFMDCDCCPICDLKYKRVLVKREVVVGEKCTTKCVPVELPCNCEK